MKKTKLSVLAIALFAFATVGNAQQGSGVTSTTNCVPPSGGEYAAQFHGHYGGPGGNGYDLTDPIHSHFTGCNPLPAAGSGATTIHTFGSEVKATVSHLGVPMQVDVPAQVTVRVTNIGPNANGEEVYDTEMLQLDLQGGNFPVGTMIRESPTLQSTGQTKAKVVAGGYKIDSFFDIFTELSVDGGQTWMPSTTGPGHVVLQPAGTGIPTMGEWGLIIFSGLMIAFAVSMLYGKRAIA